MASLTDQSSAPIRRVLSMAVETAAIGVARAQPESQTKEFSAIVVEHWRVWLVVDAASPLVDEV